MTNRKKKKRAGETRHPETKAGQKPPSRLRSLVSFRNGVFRVTCSYVGRGAWGGGVLCLCGVLGHLAPVHRSARSVCCLCVRCPGPLGFCSLACPLGALFCLCVVLGHLTPVHRYAPLVRCVACALSLATWLLYTGVRAWCVLLLVQCP